MFWHPYFTFTNDPSGPVAPTDLSSLSLVNISGLSGRNGLGTEELDAIYVGKAERP